MVPVGAAVAVVGLGGWWACVQFRTLLLASEAERRAATVGKRAGRAGCTLCGSSWEGSNQRPMLDLCPHFTSESNSPPPAQCVKRQTPTQDIHTIVKLDPLIGDGWKWKSRRIPVGAGDLDDAIWIPMAPLPQSDPEPRFRDLRLMRPNRHHHCKHGQTGRPSDGPRFIIKYCFLLKCMFCSVTRK
jgi:hypothetical protein